MSAKPDLSSDDDELMWDHLLKKSNVKRKEDSDKKQEES